MSDDKLAPEQHEETIMLMIHELLDKAAPDVASSDEGFPVEVLNAMAAIQRRLRAALSECAASVDPAIPA